MNSIFFKLIGFVVLSVWSFQLLGNDQNRRHWKILGVKAAQNGLGQSFSIESQLFWRGEWNETKTETLKKHELKPLLKYFKVEKIADLSGKEFDTSVGNNPIDEIRLMAIFGSDYQEPALEFYSKETAKSLSSFRCPEFPTVPLNWQHRFFSQFFMGKVVERENFLADVKKALANESATMALNNDKPENFIVTIRGPGEYLNVTQGPAVLRFILTGSVGAFICEPIAAAD